MTDGTVPSDYPPALAAYWIAGAELKRAQSTDGESPGRDHMGNSGRIREVLDRARLCVLEPRLDVVDVLLAAGLQVSFEGSNRTEMERPRQARDELLADPFVLEDSLKAVIQGRDFPGLQRKVVAKKVAALRAELDDAQTTEERKERIAPMLAELESGLLSTVDLVKATRRFLPHIEFKEPIESFGEVVPIRTGTRIVYRVNCNDGEAGREGTAEPMVFHVLGVGRNEAALLFTGGVTGLRQLTDLETSRVHNAWFSNRERRKCDATAPWIGRELYRELRDQGTGEIVVHGRRDAEPIAIEKIGEDTAFLRIDGRPLEVPVLRCRTSQQDDLVILQDETCPLVLRLDEKGAELIRTIDDVLSAPGHDFVFEGDGALASVAAEIDAAMDELETSHKERAALVEGAGE